ncbi:MAG: putative mycofactocin biosynthesis glycosyltransferase MftF [Firmicutes bacterium]|nr:putative mycofactocin biosynthesis glycosyltransferase MftF [Bacillota bacterium]
MSEPKISVIIPVRNEADKIERCLEAVFSQSLKPYEVIVVDGNSTDGTVDTAQKFPVKILYEDYHNRAGGCQIGTENAEGEYIAFTDADCIPDREWLANLVKELDDGIAGVGGRYEDIGKGLWTRSINLTFRTPLSGAKSRWTERRVVKNLSVCGANGMCRREDILRVGGFRVTLSGAEDLELSSRLSKLGPLVYTPDALVLHNHDRGLKDFAKQAYRYGGWRRESRLWDVQVVPPVIAPLLLISLIFTPWLCLGALALYAIAIIMTGIRIAIQEGKPVYLVSIPAAYIVQHLFYIIGFWKETIRPRKRGVPWK